MTRIRTLAAAFIVAIVALPGAARAVYPPEGQDYFESRAQVFVTPVPGCATDVILLDVVVEGPTLVRRSAPTVLPSGQPHIDTEIVSMSLTSTGGPPITINEDPDRPSTGAVTAQDPGTDFPADSFFDVFVEVDIGFLPGVTFENIAPVHMQSVIYSLPPHAFPYLPPPGTCIPLKVEGGPDIPVLWLIHADHWPDTLRECFAVTASGKLNTNPPYYPSFLSAMGEAQFVRGIAPPGHDVIDIEMVALQLHGTVQDPFRGPQRAALSEPHRIGSPGRLSGPTPGDMWHVDSFFDVFVDISIDTGEGSRTESFRGGFGGSYGPHGGEVALLAPAPSSGGDMLMEELSLNFSKIACTIPYPRD